MDIKVKDMLTLIEEDADSFAKRAEMYYKKRPELISLVEEFYRAYRALAERYDHISGELHHAQCSMGDALPSQPHDGMESISPQDSLLNRHNQFHTMKELEEFQCVMKDTDHEYLENKETEYAPACLKEMENQILNAKNEPGKSAEVLEPQSDSNKLIELQREIFSLHQEKEILKREREKGAQKFRVVEEQLLQMQEELHHAQEESHKLVENSPSHVARINELEEQVTLLKQQTSEHVEETEALRHKLQSETQENKKLIMKIQSLEIKLNKAERQTTQIEANHECSSPDHGNKGNNFSNLQDEIFKLHHDNHNLRMQVMTGVQQLQNANDEIQKLHQALLKSQTENDNMIFQYQQSLKLYESAEKRARDLQIKMALVQEENRRIKDEIVGGVLRTKITEGGHNLERETISFQPNYWHQIQRTDFLQGLRGKQDVEQNPGMKILDETSQVFNFDVFLKNCQQSLSQSQEQQNKLSEELQKGNERLKNADNRIKLLEEEINILQRENDNITQKSSSAVITVKNLEQDVYNLKQERNNLLNEVAFRVDQRDALQQELYCLKEDRNDLDRKFQVILKQLESLGLDVDSLNKVFVSLENTKQKLRDYGQIGDDENVTIPQILLKMEELLQKIETLENSVMSHQLGADRFKFTMKLLEQHIDGLQKEKSELMDESKRWNSQIRDLEAKLDTVNNLYSQLQRESQQNKDKLADALGSVEHLEEKRCSLQGEKEALRKEIMECTLQMSYSQKQVDLLEGEVKDLRSKLEEEIDKEQILEIEIKKLQQIICEIENRNQTLSDDYYRLNVTYGAAKKKVKEMEEINFKQQTENDMVLHKFSSINEFKRDLELEIENLQMLLGIPYNVEEKIGNAGVDGTEILQRIEGEVKNLQKELSHFQEENEMFLNDSLAKTTQLEQLQKDISVLCSEKESIKKEAALGLDNLLCLQKEKSQLQEEIRSLNINLEAATESGKNLNSEVLSLQQSWTSSISECLALECNYQTLLEEYNSTQTWLEESESKLLEMEHENQTFLIEALSQVSLLGVLESMIVEKDVHMQLMGQINNFQEKDAKLEYWLQSCCLKPQMQEVEILSHQELICGFQKEEEEMVQGAPNMANGLDENSYLYDQKVSDHDKGRVESLGEFCQEGTVQDRYRQLVKSFSYVQPDNETLEMKENEFQQKVSTMTEDKLKVDGILDRLHGEQEREDDKIMCSTNQTGESWAMSEELQEQRREYRKERHNVQDLAVSSKTFYRSPQSSPSMTYFEDEQWKLLDENENHKLRACECNEGIVSLENERGKQVEVLKAAENRELEIVCYDLEEGKRIRGAQKSSILTSSRKEDMCTFREEGTNLLSQMEVQKTNIQKWQGHWRRRLEADVSVFQQGDTGMNHDVESQAQNMLKRQSDISPIRLLTNEKEEISQPLKDECQHRIKEICDDGASSEHIENNNMQMEPRCKILQIHKERMPKDDLQSKLSDTDVLNIKFGEIKETETQKLGTKSEETLSPVPEVVRGPGAKSEAQDMQSQISELQNLVKGLQEENNELKCPGWKNSAVCSIMGKEYPQVTNKNLKFTLVEGPSDDQEEKEVRLEEVWSTQSIQEKVRHDMYHLQEQNQKLWTRFDSATQQIHKLQITFQELQEKLLKTRKDNKKGKADGQTEKENNAIEKQFRELQDELLLWLECNGMLTKEVQNKLVSANKLQAELDAEGGHLTEESEDTEFVFSQGANTQKELLSIQEQTSKIADVLRAGSDQARGLEFEVEKILLKFQGDTKISMAERHKKAYIPRVRTSLRVFLFGKEEHRQKQLVGCACMQPVTNE
ncbi:hypothetical protein SUGI_0249340 [Cryptomeria japonica]|nr:protein NETWORKED 1A isoform X2 [Cryptomeria japonica]GLJ15245.1 hypothetical protein SUGI_0249340 [Cryptomeria japonica]